MKKTRELDQAESGQQLTDFISRAQRLSTGADIEMYAIQQSMKRVNASLATARKNIRRRPQELISLASTVRREARLQKKCDTAVQTAIADLSLVWESLAQGASSRELTAVRESIALRIADLDYSLKSRRTAMKAAGQAPENWLSSLRLRRIKKKMFAAKLLSILWKIDVVIGLAVLFLPLAEDSPMGFANMLLSGAVFLVASWTATVLWHWERTIANARPLPRV